jgi:hypothetical protein
MPESAKNPARDQKLEALRAEIDRGIRALDRGDYIEVATEEQARAYFEDICRQGDERARSKKLDRRRTDI